MLQMIKDIPKLNTPQKVRIKFSKGNALIYISHLDLVRTLTRAIIRARIPVKYTEGYNPIPKMVFATPLSVGCSSECEYLDIRIDREISFVDIYKNLSHELPYGMEILDVYEPTSKFTEAQYSGYKIEISDPLLTSDCIDKLRDKFNTSELVITKRSKSGDKQVDILPYIKSIDFGCNASTLTVDTILSVSSADYLNPEYIVNIIYDLLSISKDDYTEDSCYSITRKELYLADAQTRFK